MRKGGDLPQKKELQKRKMGQRKKKAKGGGEKPKAT